MTNRREGREGREREGERDRERGSRAKPGIQLVNSYKSINNYYVIIVASSGRGQLKTGELKGGMLRPSPNHDTLWLPNDDYDDGFMNPPMFLLVPANDCSQNIPMLNLVKCRMF